MIKDIYGTEGSFADDGKEDIIIHYDINMKCILIELYRDDELIFQSN